MMEIILLYAVFHIKLLSGDRNNQDSETSLAMYAGTQCKPRLFTNLDLTHNKNSKHISILKKVKYLYHVRK